MCQKQQPRQGKVLQYFLVLLILFWWTKVRRDSEQHISSASRVCVTVQIGLRTCVHNVGQSQRKMMQRGTRKTTKKRRRSFHLLLLAVFPFLPAKEFSSNKIFNFFLRIQSFQEFCKCFRHRPEYEIKHEKKFERNCCLELSQLLGEVSFLL